MHLSIWIGLDSKSNCVGIHRCDFLHPNTPKYTQIHPKYTQIYPNTASDYIISILLFWDVLWIINDLLAPLSLFFPEFQQNSQFLRTISNDPDLGRVLTITNIHKYTLKFPLSKVHRIINNYLLYIIHVEFIPVIFCLITRQDFFCK